MVQMPDRCKSLRNADRLTPRCTETSWPAQANHNHLTSHDSHTSRGHHHLSSRLLSRPHHHSLSPVQAKAKDIVRKYKKTLRAIEYRRLQAIVPTVCDNAKATKTDILEESARYIDALHQRLLEQVHRKGLPKQLRQHDLNGANMGPRPELTSSDLQSMLGVALGPQLEAKLAQKSLEDRLRLQRILVSTGDQ